MWECCYSKEPVDFKLLWLRFVNKIWIILLATVMVSMVFTGIYVGSRLISKGGRTYRAKDVLDIAYVGDKFDRDEDYFYFNYYTWKEVADFDVIVDRVYEDMQGKLTKQQIMDCTTAGIEADVHHIYLYSDTNNQELSIALSDSFRNAIIAFIEDYDRIESVDILSSGVVTDITNLKIPRAVITGLILGFLISCLWILVEEVTDSSIRVPHTLEKRYHIPTLTTPSMQEFKANCESRLCGLHNIAVVPVDSQSIPDEINLYGSEYTVFSNALNDAKELEAIKLCDTCIICVAAGMHNGKRIDRMLEQLGRNDIRVDYSMLVKEDEKLINRYYR